MGAFENCESVLRDMEMLQPEIVLLDVTMPVMGGFPLAVRIHDSWPAIKIIFVSHHVDQAYVERAMEVGASGYVVKRNLVADLLPAIREVSAGNTYVSPSVRRSA
jgi:DNA-binding NarL/FixJ family response regulator